MSKILPVCDEDVRNGEGPAPSGIGRLLLRMRHADLECVAAALDAQRRHGVKNSKRRLTGNDMATAARSMMSRAQNEVRRK